MSPFFNRSQPFLPRLIFFALLISACWPMDLKAVTDLRCYMSEADCKGGGNSSTSTNPSTTNQVRINPSAVPTEKGFGVEGILFQSGVDFGVVQGLGRVGAAISPSNSEETFFGPPGLEYPQAAFERKLNSGKYPSQKVTLATAVELIKRKDAGVRSYGLKLGLLAKYNRLTQNTTPGAGLSAVLGPFTFGYSVYNDQTQLDDSIFLGTEKPVVPYQVITYSAGLSLNSLLVDYSVLHLETTDTHDVSTVRLLTASLLLKKVILTASSRIEDSTRLAYNFETHQMEEQQLKAEIFGGVQVKLTKNLMVGILYNYYLLREASVSATLFF